MSDSYEYPDYGENDSEDLDTPQAKEVVVRLASLLLEKAKHLRAEFPGYKQFDISDMPATRDNPDGKQRMNPSRNITITFGDDGALSITLGGKNIVAQRNAIAQTVEMSFGFTPAKGGEYTLADMGGR